MAEKDLREGTKQQRGDSVKLRLVKSFLTPIAAGAASAAAGYAAKKAPALLEQKLLPKLKSLADGAGEAAHELPSRAKSVTSGAGDVAQELGERAKSLVTSDAHHRPGRGRAEIARRREERARGRADRRKARTS
jgi:hypothetical protein